MLDNYDAYIFDLDGTIYRGTHIIPFADETVRILKNEGKKVIFISNKTIGSNSDYYYLLKNFGIDVELDEIVNSTTVVKKYLIENHFGESFFAVGEKIFIDELKNAGMKFSENPNDINIVLITLDRTLNYQKLEIAARSLENGAKFYAANIDDTCPVDDGEILDAGATISALQKRTHKKLEINFGKPSKFMMEEVTRRLGVKPEKCLLIGDRLETDIAMGNNFGIDTVHVQTGVKNHLNGNLSIKPTYVLNSVYDILSFKLKNH